MTTVLAEPRVSRRDLLKAGGVMVVAFSSFGSLEAIAAPATRSLKPDALDSWIAISKNNIVTVYSGRIDMGTGIATGYAQIVADELYFPVERIRLVMGDTATTPNQGKTTASNGLNIGAQPIRVAAAQARAALVRLAGQKLGVPISEIETTDGAIHVKGSSQKGLSYGALIGDQTFDIALGVPLKDTPWGPIVAGQVALKSPRDYTVVGKSVPRIDVPAKVIGTHEFVHNVRVPGMLHGRVVRPPAFGAKFVSLDEASVKGVQIVQRADFVGVVAAREEDAIRAAQQLKVTWSPPLQPALPDKKAQYDELQKQPVIETQTAFDEGDAPTAIANSKNRLKAEYRYPYQLHGMIGPSCAVADAKKDSATIWSGSQWPQGDRDGIAKLLGLPLDKVTVICRAASGSYGRLGADDAAADAALMSQAVGKPVRVQWMRHDEHGWEPVSPGMIMSVEGALDDSGKIAGFDYTQWSISHGTAEQGNYVAWRLLGTAPGYKRDSGSIGALWYNFPRRGRSVFVQPKFRAIYMRSPGGIQSTFAVECFMDELAAKANADPIEFRLRHSTDARDREALTTVAKMANWQARANTRQAAVDQGTISGRGVALIRGGFGDTRVAMIADVTVERATGRVRVTKVFVAKDAGIIVNPDAVRNQIQGAVIQGLSRSLREEVGYSQARITSLDWEQYPIFRFSDVPDIEIELLNRLDQPPSGVGELSTMPTTAAVANAIFDATGVRLREAPFTPERVKASL